MHLKLIDCVREVVWLTYYQWRADKALLKAICLRVSASAPLLPPSYQVGFYIRTVTGTRGNSKIKAVPKGNLKHWNLRNCWWYRLLSIYFFLILPQFGFKIKKVKNCFLLAPGHSLIGIPWGGYSVTLKLVDWGWQSRPQAMAGSGRHTAIPTSSPM